MTLMKLDETTETMSYPPKDSYQNRWQRKSNGKCDIDCPKSLTNSITRIFRRIYDKWHGEYVFFLFIDANSIQLVRLS